MTEINDMRTNTPQKHDILSYKCNLPWHIIYNKAWQTTNEFSWMATVILLPS